MLYCPSIKDCNLHSKHRQTLLTCLRLPPSHPGAVLPSIMEQEADKWAEINCFNYQASLLPSLLILFIRSTAALSRYHWDVWEPGTPAYSINGTCVLEEPARVTCPSCCWTLGPCLHWRSKWWENVILCRKISTFAYHRQTSHFDHRLWSWQTWQGHHQRVHVRQDGNNVLIW